jgi:hypothetical protein
MRFTALCLVLAGCGFFTGSSDDDQTCPAYGTDEPAESVRDPSTGACDYLGGGGEGCTPTPGCACPDKEPAMGSNAGAECNGPCSNLDEQSCLANNTCHASYLDNGSGEDSFWSCWDIAPQTPEGSAACAGLDPVTCSLDPSCASLFSTDSNGGDEFESCITPPDGCDCGSGYYCEQACACPAGSGAGSGCTCQPTCVPVDPTCNLTCPSGEVCMESCSASGSCIDSCIPSSQDPGQCSGPVTCNMAPPACPPGTTAGIDNDCYTGYCIPNADCAPEDCASITTEAACTARSDCEAVYTGTNCTCDESGCTCTTLTFDRCESLASSGSGSGSGI